jgi:hypothetical protein
MVPRTTLKTDLGRTERFCRRSVVLLQPLGHSLYEWLKCVSSLRRLGDPMHLAA